MFHFHHLLFKKYLLREKKKTLPSGTKWFSIWDAGQLNVTLRIYLTLKMLSFQTECSPKARGWLAAPRNAMLVYILFTRSAKFIEFPSMYQALCQVRDIQCQLMGCLQGKDRWLSGQYEPIVMMLQGGPRVWMIRGEFWRKCYLSWPWSQVRISWLRGIGRTWQTSRLVQRTPGGALWLSVQCSVSPIPFWMPGGENLCVQGQVWLSSKKPQESKGMAEALIFLSSNL